MRNLLTTVSAALIVASMGTAAFAAAAMTDTGSIKSLDAPHKKITLSDGKAFVLGSGVEIASLTVGEKVKVTYTTTGNVNTASAVTMVQ